MRATLSNYRQSPRKVRLVADLIKGQTVPHAYLLLANTPKRATKQMKKLLDSAVANAKQKNTVDESELIVDEIRVDKGVTLQRYRPVSRGSAHPIRKRTSNVSLSLKKKAKKSKAQMTNNKKKTKK